MTATVHGDVVAAPARGSRTDLRTYSPLAKVLGPVPVMVYVVTTRDLLTPALVGLLAFLVLAVAGRQRPRTLVAVGVGGLVMAAVMTLSFGVLTDPALVDDTPLVAVVGPFELHAGALETGAATAVRTTALLMLVLLGGLTTSGADLVRALTQQLRVPYRIGYAALAALRFVPRFSHELAVIRGAHRVRGVAPGAGPLRAVRRRAGYVVPLLAGGIRHAERVSLAMEARGFGAHPTRTDRVVMPFGARDVVLIVSFLAGGVACALLGAALT